MGRELARLHPVEADLVVPVPDSGNYAALGYSEELGIPFEHAFVRNHYIGRTFLQPTQLIRDFNVRIKLNLIKGAVKGKRVVVVDDSIVRGTTARARVVSLREAGAKEVHMRVSCPPHRFACHYGIDFPDPKNLLANQLYARGNLRIPRRGQRRLPGRGRHGPRHRAAGEQFLPGVLHRAISRAGRPGPGQVHHGTARLARQLPRVGRRAPEPVRGPEVNSATAAMERGSPAVGRCVGASGFVRWNDSPPEVSASRRFLLPIGRGTP